MSWWVKYGFSKNPLDIRPNKLLIGLEDQERELEKGILNGEIILLYGPLGSGKTSLILKVRDKLRNFIWVYLNGELDKNKDITAIINSLLYKKFLFLRIRTNKKVVLVIDEAQMFDEKFFEKIKALYDFNKIYSVILVQIPPELSNVSPSFKSRISRKIKLDYPSLQDIIKIVNLRLGSKLKIKEAVIADIAKACNNNVRCVFIALNKYLEGKSIGPFKNLGESPQREISIKLSKQQEEIIKVLLTGSRTIKDIAESIGKSYNTVSKQVSRLYQKGIVEKAEKDGKIYYKISDNYFSLLLELYGR